MAPNESHDKKIDGGKEGDHRNPQTTPKIATESISADQQAQPNQKFRSFSGTHDNMLVASHADETPEQHRARQDAAINAGKAVGQTVSEFVLEDKARGVEVVAGGERPTTLQPRRSFIEGLKKFVQGAKTAEEEVELQSKFSIEYMMRKMQEFAGAAQNMFNPNAVKEPQGNGELQVTSDVPVTGDMHVPTGKQRVVGAAETVRELRADNTRAVVAGGDDAGLMYLLDKIQVAEKVDAPAAKPTLTQDALRVAADSLFDAIHQKGLLNLPAPDAQRVINTISTMSEADRAGLLQTYKHQHHEDFSVVASGLLDPAARLQVKSLLNLRDGQSDDLASVELSLTTLSTLRTPDQQRHSMENGLDGTANPDLQIPVEEASRNHAEKCLRETIGSLAPADLGRLFNKYAESPEHKGHNLAQDLLNNEQISEPTRQALSIYLKHGANLTYEDRKALAEIGLQHHHIDIFEEAFANNPDPLVSGPLRKEFSSESRQHAIRESFAGSDGGGDDAIDFVETGTIRTLTLIKNDIKLLHTDQDSINFALQHATTDEQMQFRAGLEVAFNNSIRQANGDKGPFPEPNETYKRYHEVLDKASRTPRELAMWEAQLSRGGGLIVDLASLHKDGWGIPHTPIHGEGEHNFDKVLKTIDDMSEAEWTALKKEPTYRKQLDDALRTFITYKMEYDPIRELIDAKLSANTYEESKQQSIDSLRLDFNAAHANQRDTPPMDLPKDAPAVDILKAFVDGRHNATADDAQRVLLDCGDLGKLKNDYASKFHRDLSSDVLGKLAPSQRLEFGRMLTDGYHNPRQELYKQLQQQHDQSSPLGDGALGMLYSGSATDAERSNKLLFGYVQDNAANITSISQEGMDYYEQLLERAQGSQNVYVGSKRQFSEDFVNTSMGVAAFAASPLSGGGSWELYATMMAAGGTFKVGAKAAIEGGTYRSDRAVADFGTGAVSTGTAFIGPGMFGVVKGAAGSSARALIGSEGKNLVAGVTEKQLSQSLEQIGNDVLRCGPKSADELAERRIAELASQVATKGNEAEVASFLSGRLRQDLMYGSGDFLKRSIYEYTLTAASGGVGGGINAFSEAAFDGDYSRFAERTIRGFIDGYVGASVLHGLFHGAVAIKHAMSGEFAGRTVASVKVGGQELQTQNGHDWSTPDGRHHIQAALCRTGTGDPELRTAHGDFVVDAASGDTTFVSPDGKTTLFKNSEANTLANASDSASTLLENPLLGPQLNLGLGEKLALHGQEWTVKEIEGPWITLECSRSFKMSRGELLSRRLYDDRQISEFKVGKEIRDGNGRYVKIQEINGVRPNETFTVVEAEGTTKRFSYKEVVQEHPDIVRLQPKEWLASWGDPKVDALNHGKLTLATDERYYPLLNEGEGLTFDERNPPPWYRGVCRDAKSGQEIPVVFRSISQGDAAAWDRFQNEMLAQRVLKELNFEGGAFPATGVAEADVNGVKTLGLVQEDLGKQGGEIMRNALPKLLGTKLYDSADMKSVPLTREEIAFALGDDVDAEPLLSSLKQRAQSGDQNLQKASNRFEHLLGDHVRCMALRNDAQLVELRAQLEEAFVARQIIGDFDDHGKNFIVTEQFGKIAIYNIDMGMAFKPNAQPRFMCGRVDDINTEVVQFLSDKPLSAITLQRIDSLVQDPAFEKRLKQMGIPDSKIDGILARARYFATTRRFPKWGR